jgi:signal transduction histidine kinase/ligand-binding sensor domain-containing protein
VNKRWVRLFGAFFLTLGLLSLQPPLSTNAQLQSPRFQHLTTAQGLAHEMVLCVLQDRQGYLWIGTQRGLNRFDGYTFTLYRHSFNDPNSLSNDTIQALYEDARGWLWVGTASGLDHLDPERHQIFRHPEVYESIEAFAEDAQGRLWIGTGGSGLFWFDPTDETFHSVNETLPAAEPLPDNVINALYASPTGVLWLGTDQHGLLALDTTQTPMRWIHAQAMATSLPVRRVTSIAVANDGIIWVGGGEHHERQGGLFQFDPLPGQILQIVAPFANLHVTSLLFHPDQSLWVGTDSGLYRFHPSSQQVETFLHDPLDPYSLSDNQITALLLDRSLNVWIATKSGGLDRYSPVSNRFPYYPSNLADPQKHTYATVGAVLKDRQGLVWVGFHDQGLAMLDRQQGSLTRFHHDPQDPHSLAHEHVTALYQDRRGALWIGTQGGLDRFDREAFRFEHIVPNPQHSNLSTPLSIKVLTEDLQGNLWAGLEDPGGLLRIDPDRTSIQRYGGDPQSQDGFPVTFGVRAIYPDQQGNLWLGTYNGLIWFNPQADLYRPFRHDPNNPNSLSHDFVWAIHESQAGILWVGTHAGLNRLSFPCGSIENCEPQFTVYSRDQGLPDDSVVSILEDYEGHLWIATMGGGLAVYDPAQDRFQSYTERDGLQSNAFVIGAASRAEDGELFFGGLKGFNAFYPQNLVHNPIPPPIVLTAFREFDQLKEFPKDLNHIDEIRIPSRISFFAFEFAALDYSDPPRNQYAYKLEGFDQDWIACGNRRYASYTNLPPGAYRFWVKGSNSDGVWNENGKSVRLIITPAWYQTGWFRLGVVLALVGIAGGYLYSRQKQVDNLRRSEARYRTLFENAPIGVCEADFRQFPPLAIQFNPRWVSLFACSGEPQRRLDHYLPTEMLARCRDSLAQSATWTTETSGRRCDGEEFLLRFSASAVANADLSRCILVVEDISAEKARRSEEEAIAEERRRIAREIHDGLAQDLAAIRLQVHRWQQWIESDPRRLWSELENLHTLLGEKIREVRRAIFALRPVALDELGFWKAFDRFLQDFDEQNQLHTFLSVQGDRTALEPCLEPLLFRILQEALHNVARHAQAQTVWVEIDFRQGVLLRVRDDGVGFDPAILGRLESEGHLGLQQMRERVEALGGSLRITSQIGKGTQIEVLLGNKRTE